MSDKTAEDKFWEKTKKFGDCIVWTGARNRQGYGLTTMDGEKQYAHRAIMLMRGADLPPGAYVCHHCDNPPCVNPDHLFVGTHKENMIDRVKKRTAKRDEKKLKREKISRTYTPSIHEFPRMIAHLNAKGWTQTDIAKAVKTNQANISAILKKNREPRYFLGARICKLYEKEVLGR